MFQQHLLQQLRHRFTRISCALAAVVGLCAPQLQAAEVDLLVLYDSHSANYFNQQTETAMYNWVAQINNAYRDSQVDLQLRLVGVVAHEETGTSMGNVLDNLRQDTTAISLRTRYGADFVTQLHKTGSCGVAYLAVHREWAWSVIGPDCGPLTLAHELGHNMGLAHSRKQGDTKGSRYAYGLGYGVDGLFGTIMSYSWLYTTRSSGKVARFSNPEISCLGVPCGVAAGQPDQAYAALAINNVKSELAAFRAAAAQSSVSSSRSSQQASSVAGGSGITVRARGTSGVERINLKVAGTVVASWTLTTSHQSYVYAGNAAGNIQVEFTNDASGRDVILDYIIVNGETRQAESMTSNTATYANGACGGGGRSETMHCNGYIGFGNTYDCVSGSCSGNTSSTSGNTSSTGGTTSSRSSSSVSMGGQCQCNWYGTLYPSCVVTQSGWGWENSRSCISNSTCNSQQSGTGGVVCP